MPTMDPANLPRAHGTSTIPAPRRSDPPARHGGGAHAEARPLTARLTTAAHAVLVLAPFLLLVELGRESLWVDETFSVGTAKLPLAGLWESFTGNEPNMNLYYLLLHFVVQVGDSEFWVRAPSAVSAALAVSAVWVLGRRLYGPATGYVAGALLAVNGFFVIFGREARGYTLGILLLTVATLLLVGAVERPSMGRWLGYSAIAALSLYVHFLAGLVVLGHALSLTLVPRSQLRFRMLVAAASLFAVIAAPLTVLVAGRGPEPLHWIDPTSLASVTGVWQDLTGYGAPWLGLPFLVLVLVGAAAAITGLPRPRTIEAWRRALPVFWVLTPIVGLLAVSLAVPMFISRYLTLILPGIALVCAFGVSRVPAAWGRALVAVVLVTASAYGAGRAIVVVPKDDWRAAVGHVVANTRPGDGVLLWAPHTIWAYRYYEGRQGRSLLPGVVYPTKVSPGTYSPETFDSPFDEIAAAPDRYQRIWVVFNQFDREEADEVLAAVSRRYSWVSGRGFDGMWLHLFELPARA